MDIALLTFGFSTKRKEAAGITTLLYARELKKLGYNPIVISNNKCAWEGNLPKYEVSDGIKIYRPFKGKLIDYAYGINYVQKKENIKFDIIHNFSNSPVLALRAVFSKIYSKNAKSIQTIKAESGKMLGNFIFSIFLNFVDAVTVPTEILKKN